MIMLATLLALIRAYIIARLARLAVAQVLGASELSDEDIATIEAVLLEEVPGLADADDPA